jgi:uncharacterized membrane-anchored protein YhcB (DUF1043 family)
MTRSTQLFLAVLLGALIGNACTGMVLTGLLNRDVRRIDRELQEMKDRLGRQR